MKSTMMSAPLLVNSLLERAGALFPDVAIVSMQPDGSPHSYSYRDLRRRSRQLAAALEGAGVAKGDRVATLMWNGHEHLEAYFGVPLTGAVLHTLNLRLHPDELAYIVNHADDSYVLFDITFAALVDALAPQCPKVRGWIALTDDARQAMEKSHADSQSGERAPKHSYSLADYGLTAEEVKERFAGL